jgi:hypothetical protein
MKDGYHLHLGYGRRMVIPLEKKKKGIVFIKNGRRWNKIALVLKYSYTNNWNSHSHGP